MDNRIGVSTCYLDGENVLGRLQQCYNCGFSFLELTNLKDNRETGDLFKKLSIEQEHSQARIRSIHLPFGTQYDISDIDDNTRNLALCSLINIVKMASVLKPEFAILHASYEPIADNVKQKRINACVQSLKVLCSECSKYSIKVAVECLPRTCIGNTSAELLYLISNVKHNIGICFDTNHLTQESNIDFIKNAGKYIVTTHVSDFDGVNEKHWLPGQGCINWNDLLWTLRDQGYEGPAIFEVQNQKMDFIDSLKLLRGTWEKILLNKV